MVSTVVYMMTRFLVTRSSRGHRLPVYSSTPPCCSCPALLTWTSMESASWSMRSSSFKWTWTDFDQRRLAKCSPGCTGLRRWPETSPTPLRMRRWISLDAFAWM